jgi:hypothetical protein
VARKGRIHPCRRLEAVLAKRGRVGHRTRRARKAARRGNAAQRHAQRSRERWQPLLALKGAMSGLKPPRDRGLR